MLDRKRYEWVVTLQAEDGQVREEKVKAYWDPEHETTEMGVGDAGRVQANRRHEIKHATLAVARA